MNRYASNLNELKTNCHKSVFLLYIRTFIYVIYSFFIILDIDVKHIFLNISAIFQNKKTMKLCRNFNVNI